MHVRGASVRHVAPGASRLFGFGAPRLVCVRSFCIRAGGGLQLARLYVLVVFFVWRPLARAVPWYK